MYNCIFKQRQNFKLQKTLYINECILYQGHFVKKVFEIKYHDIFVGV